MFQNATVSSRSSSSRSGHSCSRNSSMPSLRMRSPLSPKTSYNPLYRHSDALTSFDASHFIFRDQRRQQNKNVILRRYNSHDSHTTTQMDDMCKDNTPDSTKSRTSASTSSTTPGTSPDSTGLRLSSATNTTSSSGSELEARDFLERYSLPRVVRVADGLPLLLYRCFDSFTKVQARGLHVKKNGKEKLDEVNVLQFPEGYPGWFSLLNEKGEKCAVTHTSVLQLVREQVCSFISMQPFTAYAGHNLDPNETQSKVQYVKTQVKPGQLFQLRAVFQHRDMEGNGVSGNQNHSKASVTSRIGRSTRDKDLANRYAQLISQTNQEFYVQLTMKGEFYEIHSSIKAKLCFPGLLDKTGPLALDKDCLYKLTHLLRRIALPIRVKLMSGPLPLGLPKDFPDTFILERKFQEPLMVTCTLPAPSEKTPHQISCININSGVRISRCMLGFDSENRLFKSQRLQAALAFCHKNVESWYREVRLSPNLNNQVNYTSCFECRKLNRLCSETCPHRTKDTDDKQIINKEMIEKFSKPKKWYKHFKILGSTTDGGNKDKEELVENTDKVKSIDRYKDMSKLIEEKFGKKSHNPVKKSASFMFSTKRIDLQETPTQTKNNPTLLKCQSLDTQLYSIDENQSVRKHGQWRNSKSNVSETFSTEFQNCILENENTVLTDNENSQSTKSLQTTDLDLDEIKPVEDVSKGLRKLKPDLIPTLAKDDHSYITDRLCSEFHVKTKIQQKRSISKHSLLAANFEKSRSSLRVPDTINPSLSIFDVEVEDKVIDGNTKSVVVQVHEDTVLKAKSKLKKRLLEEDIPYSNVADEVRMKPNGRKTLDENIYSEICDDRCQHCGGNGCTCSKKASVKTASEYCYVKLGSNGDSVTQSDSDEAIYNTLR